MLLIPQALKQSIPFVATICVFYLLPIRIDASTIFQGIVALGVLGFLAFAITKQLRKQTQRLFDLVTLLFIAAHGCAFVCYALAVQEPEQFSGISTRTDALYFTITTMSTVGFGDIHPVGQQAKMLVIAMIIFDLVFLAALAHAISEGLQQAMPSNSTQTKNLEEK